MIVANNLNEHGAGFQKDTNKVTMILKDKMISTECISKKELSYQILKQCYQLLNEKRGM